jgi:uncharacterized protein YoaH (UPF0181 family)
MAIIDDLVSSGLSLAQANAVISEDLTSDATDNLVAAGFSYTQALAIHAYDVSKTSTNADNMVQQGIWFGPQLSAIVSELNVTP